MCTYVTCHSTSLHARYSRQFPYINSGDHLYSHKYKLTLGQCFQQVLNRFSMANDDQSKHWSCTLLWQDADYWGLDSQVLRLLKCQYYWAYDLLKQLYCSVLRNISQSVILYTAEDENHSILLVPFTEFEKITQVLMLTLFQAKVSLLYATKK